MPKRRAEDAVHVVMTVHYIQRQPRGNLLAPLKEGGGSKLKVLESMAAGLAVVSTREGVSGLTVQDGREYREGRTSQELSARVIELFEDESQLRRIGESGRAYVQQKHDWTQLAQQLLQIYGGLPKRSCAVQRIM